MMAVLDSFWICQCLAGNGEFCQGLARRGASFRLGHRRGHVVPLGWRRMVRDCVFPLRQWQRDFSPDRRWFEEVDG